LNRQGAKDGFFFLNRTWKMGSGEPVDQRGVQLTGLELSVVGFSFRLSRRLAIARDRRGRITDSIHTKNGTGGGEMKRRAYLSMVLAIVAAVMLTAAPGMAQQGAKIS